MNTTLQRFPPTFISHGGPPTASASSRSKAKPFWTNLFAPFRKENRLPKGIIVISGHWISESSDLVRITYPKDAETLDQIYDFYGFDDELYQIKYNVHGSRQLSQRIKSTIESHFAKESKHISCALDEKRGIDHGTWIPLYLLFPTNQTVPPVVQVSLLDHSNRLSDSSKVVQAHIDLGKSLSSLVEEGYWIMGSGAETHNLRLTMNKISRSRAGWDDPYHPSFKPDDYVLEFEKYLKDAVLDSKLSPKEVEERIVHYKTNCKAGNDAHPTQDHFLPFAVALGAGLEHCKKEVKDYQGSLLFDSNNEYGSLGMGCYAFGFPFTLQ